MSEYNNVDYILRQKLHDTLLKQAVMDNAVEQVSILVKLDANVNTVIINSTPNKTWPPTGSLVHYATEKHFIEILEILLENGADPNSLNVCGETPINYIIWYMLPFTTMYETLLVLLENGADPNITNKMGSTVLDMLIGRVCHFIGQPNALSVDEYIEITKLCISHGANRYSEKSHKFIEHTPKNFQELLKSIEHPKSMIHPTNEEDHAPPSKITKITKE